MVLTLLLIKKSPFGREELDSGGWQIRIALTLKQSKSRVVVYGFREARFKLKVKSLLTFQQLQRSSQGSGKNDHQANSLQRQSCPAEQVYRNMNLWYSWLLTRWSSFMKIKFTCNSSLSLSVNGLVRLTFLPSSLTTLILFTKISQYTWIL